MSICKSWRHKYSQNETFFCISVALQQSKKLMPAAAKVRIKRLISSVEKSDANLYEISTRTIDWHATPY
jgi:hypothetical protein